MRVLVLLSLLLGACQPEAAPPPPPGAMEPTGDVVVTVNDVKVTQDMIDALTRNAPADQLAALKGNEARWREFLDTIAMQQVLYQRAIEAKVHEDPETQDVLAMAQRQILADQMVQSVAEKAVTDEKVAEMYEKRKVQYDKPSAKVQQMIVQDPAVAQQVVDQLKAGGDFAALAKAHSIDQGQNAEPLTLRKGMLNPAFDPVFEAKSGDVVGPIPARGMNVVLKVVEARPNTPLEEVRPELEEALKQEAAQEYVKKVREEMKVVYPGAPPKAEVSPLPETQADPGKPAAPPAPAAAGEGH